MKIKKGRYYLDAVGVLYGPMVQDTLHCGLLTDARGYIFMANGECRTNEPRLIARVIVGKENVQLVSILQSWMRRIDRIEALLIALAVSISKPNDKQP